MTILTTLGKPDSKKPYVDRPTVKVIIIKGDLLLLLNNGLLPGGGVEPEESREEAIRRELIEELGVTVENVKPIGTVIQYRTFLQKRYIVEGYTASLATRGHETSPQDSGEAAFTQNWMSLDKATEFVRRSIESGSVKSAETDEYQGRLYNLTTTLTFLESLQHQERVKRQL